MAMGITMATIITMATGTVTIITGIRTDMGMRMIIHTIMVMDIRTDMLTATIIPIPTAMTTDTVISMATIMVTDIRTGTAITMITEKAGKSSWSRTSSPTTTCWPSATADISRRKTSRR